MKMDNVLEILKKNPEGRSKDELLADLGGISAGALYNIISRFRKQGHRITQENGLYVCHDGKSSKKTFIIKDYPIDNVSLCLQIIKQAGTAGITLDNLILKIPNSSEKVLYDIFKTLNELGIIITADGTGNETLYTYKGETSMSKTNIKKKQPVKRFTGETPFKPSTEKHSTSIFTVDQTRLESIQRILPENLKPKLQKLVEEVNHFNVVAQRMEEAMDIMGDALSELN
jgi:Fe2+ or Zn2+ uptake regulation protein